MPSTFSKKTEQIKQSKVFEIDLIEIEGNGDFPCPTCGVMISPEDETETVYVIIEEKVKEDSLEELTIQCNACATKIRLIGFPNLESESSTR